MPSILVVLPLALTIVLFITGATLHAMFLRRLRDLHPETWRALGEPTLVMNNSIGNSMRLFGFLHRGRYRSLSDERLESLAGFLRIVETAYLVAFLAFAIGIATHR